VPVARPPGSVGGKASLEVQAAIAMAIGNRPTLMGLPAEFAATRIGITRPIPKGDLPDAIPGPSPPNMFESGT